MARTTAGSLLIAASFVLAVLVGIRVDLAFLGGPSAAVEHAGSTPPPPAASDLDRPVSRFPQPSPSGAPPAAVTPPVAGYQPAVETAAPTPPPPARAPSTTPTATTGRAPAPATTVPRATAPPAAPRSTAEPVPAPSTGTGDAGTPDSQGPG